MSDVHGLKDRYDAMLEALALQNEDTLFVLGDVIDRGRDGIAILLDMGGNRSLATQSLQPDDRCL